MFGNVSFSGRLADVSRKVRDYLRCKRPLVFTGWLLIWVFQCVIYLMTVILWNLDCSWVYTVLGNFWKVFCSYLIQLIFKYLFIRRGILNLFNCHLLYEICRWIYETVKYFMKLVCFTQLEVFALNYPIFI